jgi:hypothetical protein
MNQSYDLPISDSEEKLEELNLDEKPDNTNNEEDANELDDFFGQELDTNLYKNKFSRIVNMLNMTVENRGISQSHVVEIYTHYKKNKSAFIAPLHIISYLNKESPDNEKFFIADGQHRVEALKKLMNSGIDREILYFIHDANSEEQIREIITMLNSNVPVISTFPFEKVSNFIKKLDGVFPQLFSINTNHNDYKMNKIKLRDELYTIKLFDSIKLKENEIFNHLINYNKLIRDEYMTKPIKSVNEKKLADKISITHKFYCVLQREYTWCSMFNNYLLNL